MSMLINYFKQKLSIAITEELPQQYADKLQVIKGSLEVPDTLTENTSEQIDAVLEEFNINIKTSSIEETKNSCTILKSFAFVISENNEDALIEKLELVTALSKWHGFSSLNKITESKIKDLKALYISLGDTELNDVNYDLFDKIKAIDLLPVKQVSKLDEGQLKKFLEFCKSYGINAKIKREDLIKTSNLNEILETLKIQDKWLEDSNQKKLAVLLKASNVSEISDIKQEYVKSLSAIKKEFKFDFSKQSQLKLKSFIKILSSLGLTFASEEEKIKSIGEFINAFCKIEELSSYDAGKIAKIMKELGVSSRDKKETDEVMQLLKSFGIKFSLNGDLESELEKIKNLSARFKTILNKEIVDLSSSEIKEVNKLCETFFAKQITTTSDIEIASIKKVFQLFPLNKTTSSLDSRSLQQIFSTLEIELRETNKLENLSKNLKKLDLDIWEISRSEIKAIDALFNSLKVNITTEVITDDKKERFIKIKELLGASYEQGEIEKLKKLACTVGKEGIVDLEANEIAKLKIIIDEFGINIKDTHISEIESIALVLSAYDVKSIASHQSTFSKIWSGEDQAIKESLVQIQGVFKGFGYESLAEVKGQEKVKFENLIQLYQKDGFQNFTQEISGNINSFLSNLGLNFRELSSYKLKNITEGLKEIGVSLFESKDHLDQYEYFLKEINLDLAKLTRSEGLRISETLSLLNIDRAKIKEETDIINHVISSMHLPKLAEIKKEQVHKIKEFGEAITGNSVEVTPQIASNIGSVLGYYYVAFEAPNLSNIKYHKPNEDGLLGKVEKMQSFKIDLSNTDDVKIKSNLISYLIILHKDQCNQGSDSWIDYEKEFSGMMSLNSEKLDQLIMHADSRKECLKLKTVLSEECSIFGKEIENEMAQLCHAAHEDL